MKESCQICENEHLSINSKWLENLMWVEGKQLGQKKPKYVEINAIFW
jgi:hypothetical protein